MSTLAKIEALLFVAGEDGVRVRQLAELLSLPPTGIQQSLEKLAQKYEKAPDSSLALIETGGAYRLVTRIEIDAIRGVNSSGALAKLQAFDLIKEDGKKEVLGRPNLYVTTDYFLDYMGMNHLEELPVIDELEIQAQESQLFGERIEEDENQ